MSDLRLRDTRRANWFWVQNVLIDVFLPVIGPLGVSVYNAMCREVRNELVDTTLRELGEAATVSKDTARRMLAKMLVLKMVGVREMRRGRKAYVLYDLEDAAGAGEPKDQIARLKKALAVAEQAGTIEPKAKSRQEAALEEPNLFDDGPVEIPKSDFKALKDFEGQQLLDAQEIARAFQVRPEDIGLPSVAVCDKPGAETLSLPATSCRKTGEGLSQMEPVLSQNSDPYLMLVEDKTQTIDKTHLNPPGGRTSRDVGLVIEGLRDLKPRLGDVSDLMEQVFAHMQAAGFEVEEDHVIEDRGDGRAGKIDFWCKRGTEIVAIELDGETGRERTLRKLLRVETANRVLILRTAPKDCADYDRGIITIPLGWGTLRAKPVHGADAAQQARAGVGAVQAGARAALANLPRHTINAGTVRMVFNAVRDEVERLADSAGMQSILEEFDAAFGSVSYERHETIEGTVNDVLLSISSANMLLTEQELQRYDARLGGEFRRMFDCTVRVQMVDVDST